MEFIFGCLLFGFGFALIAYLTADIFWDVKDRRDEKNSDISNW